MKIENFGTEVILQFIFYEPDDTTMQVKHFYPTILKGGVGRLGDRMDSGFQTLTT